MQIPEHGSITSCPKCGALDSIVTTEYHEDVQPIGSSVVADPCTKLVVEAPSEEAVELEEHLCRKCSRCQFGWVEQVHTAGSVYEPPEYEHCGCDFHGDHEGCDITCAARGVCQR